VTDPTNCCVCAERLSAVTPIDYARNFRISCPRCGEFIIAKIKLDRIKGLSRHQLSSLSGTIRHRYDNGEIIYLTKDEEINSLIDSPPPTITERSRILLKEACDLTSSYGDLVKLTAPHIISRTYSKDYSDILMLLNLLASSGLIESATYDGDIKVTAIGFSENEKAPIQLSTTAFVAMWFSADLTDVYEGGFAKGIADSGYTPLRIDKVDHNGKIDDEIIVKIRNAKFIVADFTGHRGGVYFEAGYAMGLNKPVIFTCREDHLKDLHFDVRQFNTLTWVSKEDLAARLHLRIAATIGEKKV